MTNCGSDYLRREKQAFTMQDTGFTKPGNPAESEIIEPLNDWGKDIPIRPGTQI